MLKHQMIGLCLLAGSAQATWLVGEVPPDFTLTDTAGQEWTLSEHLGKVVVLNFGQTASQPCDSLFAHLGPDFADVYDPGLVTVAHVDASDADAQTLIDYWATYTPSFPILTMGSTLFADWCEGYVPHTVVVDPIGVVRGNWIGFYPLFFDQMQGAVEAAINPTGLYVGETDLSITTGDGDDVLEPGESAQLLLTLDNLGQLNVADVAAELVSDGPEVLVTGAASSYPDFAFATSHSNDQPFALQVAEDAPDAFDPTFTLHLTTSVGEVDLHVSLSVGQRVAYWSMNGENGLGDWTHAPAATGWNDVWHLSTESSHSPTHAFKAGSPTTGTYGNHDDCRLVSPPLELRDWSRLNFWHRMDGEVSTAFPDSAYDGGTVEISTDDGATWAQLTPLTGYNKWFRAQAGSGAPATHNFPGQTPCYSGSFPWEAAEFDLAAFNGQTVRLGFHFGSDNGGSLEGWYVDDLVLAAPTDDTGLGDPQLQPVALSPISCWPNPFNPATQIRFNLGVAGPVRLNLYDVAGRLVRRLHNGNLAAGSHHMVLQAGDLAGGLYFLRLEATSATRTEKLLLIK